MFLLVVRHRLAGADEGLEFLQDLFESLAVHLNVHDESYLGL